MKTQAQKLEVIANGLNKLAEKGNLIVWLESTRTVVDVDSVCVNGPAIQLKVSESPGAMLGRSKSPAKAAASRENGKRGGRPSVPCAVVRCRNVYAGTLGINGHCELVRDDFDSEVIIHPAVICGRKAIADMDRGIYVTAHGEAGRPEYWLVPESAVDELRGRWDDMSNYAWPEDSNTWDCADHEGNVCGECNHCLEWMAEEDDTLLRNATI